MRRSISMALAALSLAAGLAACDDDSGDFRYGRTTFVVVMNPVVNDINDTLLPSPGSQRINVRVANEDGPSDVTDADGIAILAGVGSRLQTLTFSGAGFRQALNFDIDPGDLRDVAMSATLDEVLPMSVETWPFAEPDPYEVTPDMSNEAINELLSLMTYSGFVVHFAAGTYTGDFVFTGPNIALVGEGAVGGNVILDGNVTIDGNLGRIRGVTITGDLAITAAGGVTISFTRVNGQYTSAGIYNTLLYNDFCGPVVIDDSNLTALGNTGLAPLPARDDC
jgi:hypothetical protein